MKKFFLFLLLAATTAYGSDYRSSLEYVRKADKDKTSVNTPLYSITFDDELYNNLNSKYTDLRIYDNKETQIPFVIKEKVDTSLSEIKNTYNAKIESLLQFDSKLNNEIELIVSGPIRKTVTQFTTQAIIIDTPSSNFEKEITIYGSNDKKDWTLLVTGEKIYDYSSIIDLRNTTIKIPDTNFNFFKIVIHNFTEKKLSPYVYQQIKDNNNQQSSKSDYLFNLQQIKINAIILIAKFAKQQISIPATKTLPLSITKTEEKEGKQIFIIKTPYAPIISFLLKTNSQNFIRNYFIEYSKNGIDYHYLNSGKIFSLSISDTVRSKLQLPAFQHRSLYYRITIFNRDNPPLQNVEIYMTEKLYHAIFLADSCVFPISIYYHGKDIPQPEYDVSEVIGNKKDLTYGELQLTAQKKNPLFNKSTKNIDKKWYSYAMYGALGLVVIVLIIVLAFSLRKIE